MQSAAPLVQPACLLYKVSSAIPEVACCDCPPLTEPDACPLQVKCVQCGHESNTHQAFLDLSLDIRREKSVRNALQVSHGNSSSLSCEPGPDVAASF